MGLLITWVTHRLTDGEIMYFAIIRGRPFDALGIPKFTRCERGTNREQTQTTWRPEFESFIVRGKNE